MSSFGSAGRSSVILLAFVGLLAQPAGAQITPNVLLIIGDDVGIGEIGVYGPTVPGSAPGRTPVLDQLAAAGVRFNQAWSNPECSPTRATLYTGRYGLHTGVGVAIPDSNPGGLGELADTEFTLPDALAPLGYQRALIGKWHLGTSSAHGNDSPRGVARFDRHAGILNGALPDYTEWERFVDGLTTGTTRTYATKKNVDDAVDWISTQAGPWMLALAFNAPHSPYHVPPSGLLSRETRQTLRTQSVQQDSDCQLNSTNKRLCYQAAIEAMDTEIGRLFLRAGISNANTVVMFFGDNGTPGEVLAPGTYDPSKAKATVFQGGIHVPLIIAGPPVVSPNSEINDPVNTTDLFPTISAIVGASNPAGTDWVNLLPYLDGTAGSPAFPTPLRQYVYAEKFPAGGSPHTLGGAAAYSDGTYKVIEKVGALGTLVQCFDISTDEFETTNLWVAPSPPAACQTLYNALEAGLHAGLP